MEIKSIGYQNRARKGLRKRRSNGFNNGLIVLATGLGKTVIAALDAYEFIHEHPGKVLFLCHDIGIMKRQLSTFIEVFGADFGFGFLTANKKDYDANFLFATFQTMKKNLNRFGKDHFQYIIVDESHHSGAASYEPVILYFTPAFLLGMTATPDREDLKDIRRIYGKEVINIPLSVALARGYLCDVEYYLFTPNINQSFFEKSEADLIRSGISGINSSLFIRMDNNQIAETLNGRISQIKNPKVGVFCNTIEEAEEFAKLLPNAKAYHSGMSDTSQDHVFKSFVYGKTVYILTVDKFNEGIDIPDMNVLVFLRSTKSRRIFFQQLGRGLRKSPNKEKVIVLDFAGNVQRISLIDQLWKNVQKEQAKREIIVDEDEEKEEEVSKNTITFNFDEKVVDLLQFLERMKPLMEQVTRETLILELQKIAHKIGHTPRTRDVARLSLLRLTHHTITYRKVFGSFNNALEAAGFSPNMTMSKVENPEDMLKKLRALAEELGRTPSLKDLKIYTKEGKIYSETMFRNYFGTYNNAVVQAGLKVNQSTQLTSEEELIKELKYIAQTTKRVPRKDDLPIFLAQGKCHSENVYFRVFGTWNKALEAAGFEAQFRRSPPATKEELIVELHRLVEELGRVPTVKEIDQLCKTGEAHSATVYRRLFGNYMTALEEAGLK